MAGQVWESDSSQYLRPRADGQSDVWTDSDAGTELRHQQRLVEVGVAVPPPAVAAALQVTDGEAAVVRRRIMYVSDRPVELADSYYPARVAAGTPLAEPRKIKGGAVTLLAALGHTIHEVIEEVVSSIPDQAAREALALPPGEPVLVLTRTSLDADHQPIEVSVMTMLHETTLRYRTRVA